MHSSLVISETSAILRQVGASGAATKVLATGMSYLDRFVAFRCAPALLRLDDLYLECFEVKDVKQTLKGDT